MSQLVDYQFADGISTITMDDGKVNAMSVTMQQAINSALDRAEKDGGVVILSGNQKIFSAGFDLQVFQRGGGELQQMLLGGAELSQRVINFPQPIVAACPGHAMAMGFFLLLACDYRIGTQTQAKLCANEVAIGLTVPHFAIEVCRQKLAPPVLYRVLNLAESFCGEEAVAAGVLDWVVADSELQAAARAKASAFSQLNLSAYKATKARTKSAVMTALEQAIRADLNAWQSR